MDFIDTNSDNLHSMDMVVDKMRDLAKVIDSRSDAFNSSDIKKIAEAVNVFADWVKIGNELAVEQAKKNAIDDFVKKIKDKFGGEK
jgi:hypothetical protein